MIRVEFCRGGRQATYLLPVVIRFRLSSMILIEATDADFEELICGRAPLDLKLPVGGVERVEVLKMLRGLANNIRPAFTPASWMMVEKREVVGLCSLVKPPSGDGVDFGYGVAVNRRRRGFASAAVGALLQWACVDHRVQNLRAETSVKNLPSQRVLERNGFDRIGERIDDEDGALICWGVATNV